MERGTSIDINKNWQERIYPLNIYSNILSLASVLLIFTELAPYLLSQNLTTISLTNLAFVFFANAMILFLFNTHKFDDYFLKPIFLWILFLLSLTCVWGLVSVLASEMQSYTISQFNRYILTCLFLISFLIILEHDQSFKIARKAIVWILLFNVCLNIYDFIGLNPDDFSSSFARAAGLYRNPNYSGIVFILGYIIVLDIIKERFRFSYTLLIFLGIALTQSRGGIITYLAVVLFFFFKRKFPLGAVLKQTVITLVVLGITIYFTYDEYLKDFVFALQDAQDMLLRYQQLMGQEVSSLNMNNDPRILLLEYNLNLFFEKPLFGHGLGASQYLAQFSPDTTLSHNLFLHQGVDFGLFGLVLVLSFLFIIIYRNGKLLINEISIIFICTFLIISFTSHNLFDSYALLFAYCMIYQLIYRNQLDVNIK